MEKHVEPDSYIEFIEYPPNPKTRRWRVVNKENRSELGCISWYGAWRKYCFKPLFNTVFEWQCLRDIANFCETETKKHYGTKRVSKSSK